MTFEQLKLIVMQARLGMTPEEIKKYILNIVDIVVQLKRGGNGRKYVSTVYFKGVKG